MTFNKLKSAVALLTSRAYVLVTNKVTVVETDFEGFDGVVQVHALKMVNTQIGDVIARWEKDNGRKPRSRSKSSPNKSGKVRK